MTELRWRAPLAVGAGLLIALSVPPAGFWPLGIGGVALLGWLLGAQSTRRRALLGFCGGMGLYAVTIFWFAEFNAIGAALSMMVEAAFLAGAAAITPPGKGRHLGWIGALILQDFVRTYVPFGGVPLGGIPLGQAAGPLAPAARVGGQLLVTGVTAAAAVAMEIAIATATRRRTTGIDPATPTRRPATPARRRATGVDHATLATAAVAALAAVAIPIAGRLAPAGHRVGTMRVAAVQGGGRRGLRAIHNSAAAVLQAQFDANRLIKGPVDLVLWPEDVIALPGPIAGTQTAANVGEVAVVDHATLVAGVTEDIGADKFRNAEVVWNSAGQMTGRYDKVHRVPFGEYIPGRWLIRHIVNLDVIPRDAIPGRGSGAVQTQAGPVGIVISFEVFFPARARSAIRAGGQVLLAPTNTSSYTTTQVPAAEVAADRLRAWETGRDVVMAAPTGWSAVVDSRGRLLQRSPLGPAAVLTPTVERRVGETPYVRWGDLPVILLSLALVGGAWAIDRT